MNFSSGYYNLVLFHVERSIKLFLKHLIYNKIGEYPKTHSIVRLFENVITLYGDKKIKEIYDMELETLYLLEEAYISSRYLPREYDKNIAERILDFGKRVIGVLRCLEKT